MIAQLNSTSEQSPFAEEAGSPRPSEPTPPAAATVNLSRIAPRIPGIGRKEAAAILRAAGLLTLKQMRPLTGATLEFNVRVSMERGLVNEFSILGHARDERGDGLYPAELVKALAAAHKERTEEELRKQRREWSTRCQ